MYMQFHGMGKHFIIMMLPCTRWCGNFTSSSYRGNKVSMLFLKFTYAIMHSCVNNSHNNLLVQVCSLMNLKVMI